MSLLDIEIVNIKELRKQYPNLVQTAKYMFPTASDRDIEKICSLVIGTCHSCYNEERGCQCWNDE